MKYGNGKPLKYKMGLATRKHHDITATWRGHGRRHHGVGVWVFVSLSTLYLYYVSPLTSLSFFFFFCFLRFLLSPFGFVLLRVRAEFFFFLLKFTWVIGSWAGWMMGFMIFGRRARAKNSGPKPFFFLILLAKVFFFGPGPP